MYYLYMPIEKLRLKIKFLSLVDFRPIFSNQKFIKTGLNRSAETMIVLTYTYWIFWYQCSFWNVFLSFLTFRCLVELICDLLWRNNFAFQTDENNSIIVNTCLIIYGLFCLYVCNSVFTQIVSHIRVWQKNLFFVHFK